MKFKLNTMKYFILSFYIFVFFSSTGCGDDQTNSGSTVSGEIVLNFKSNINGQAARLGNYFLLQSGDSILVSRLDYYLDEFSFNSSNSSLKNNDPFLYSLAKTSNVAKTTSNQFATNLSGISFLVGLDSLTNASNPTLYPGSHPLSGNQNMWWTMSTNYRYIVFEGKIKLANGTIRDFAYHTGLRFKNVANLSKNILLTSGTNNISVRLDLEKIFYPASSSNNVSYIDGSEILAHGNPGEESILSKISLNTSEAFSIE